MPLALPLTTAARRDVEALVDVGLTSARGALVRAAVFTPFPLAVSLQGGLLRPEVDTRALRRRTPEAIAARAVSQLFLLQPEVRAVALVTASRLKATRADAVEVWVEHREGAAITVLLPFRGSGTKLRFETPRAFAASRLIWSA